MPLDQPEAAGAVARPAAFLDTCIRWSSFPMSFMRWSAMAGPVAQPDHLAVAEREQQGSCRTCRFTPTQRQTIYSVSAVPLHQRQAAAERRWLLARLVLLELSPRWLAHHLAFTLPERLLLQE
jgi:hypothetical protein